MGLKNLGNSCYMKSVLQLLWALPELRQRYVDAAAEIFKSAPRDVASDFATQFAKVGPGAALPLVAMAHASALRCTYLCMHVGLQWCSHCWRYATLTPACWGVH